MVQLADQYIALIAYASAYGLLVIIIGVYVYFSRKKNPRITPEEQERTYFEQVWFAREIYTAVIIHLYDQATDVAIMVQWARFLDEELRGERDLESVNMLSFFLPGLGFIILYRVITMIFAIYEDTKTVEEHLVYRDMEKQKEHQRNKKSVWVIIGDLILCTFDLYFVKIVYLEFQSGEFKPNETHRSLQLCEALFESMPQVVLQSVFLLRYTATEAAVDDTVAISLTIISITASILSIANKYSWFDRQAVVWDAKRLNGGRPKGGECYISWRFLVRQVWRWSDLCARFVILTLVWVCVGGLYLVIYVAASYLFYYFVVLNRIKMADKNPWYRLLATTICLVGIILDYEWHFCILRLIDNGVMMAVISIFVFATFDCSDVYCSENSKRDLINTPIIFVFILMGFIAYALECITYPILQSRTLHIIKKALQGRAFFSIILFGDDDAVPCYYLTYFIECKDGDESKRGLSVQEINYFTGKKSNEDCEKLGEELETVFQSLLDTDGAYSDTNLMMDAGDIAIDAKTTKVFKYGVSIRCLQNVYHKANHLPLVGAEAVTFIQSIYEKEETMRAVTRIFDEHFKGRDATTKEWKLTVDTQETIFIVLNTDQNNENNNSNIPVVAKYRFGEEFKKYDRDVRIINGHDYTAGMHVTRKQVAIKVIDRWLIGGNKDKLYSEKNEDMFRRERINLSRLNEDKNANILPYIGWDDADDAYFIVTKRLFGPKILQRVSRNGGLSNRELMRYIREMYAVMAYVHSKHIAMNNLSANSFQFAEKEKENEDSRMYLVHYENSKEVSQSEEALYGNIQQKVLYLSPELCSIVKLRYKNKKWCANISGAMYQASDVWALGILTYYLLLGKHPFFTSGATPNKLKKTLNNIIGHTTISGTLEAFKYDELNAVFTDFMNKILCSDYRERYTMAECLQHEFLSGAFVDKLDSSERMKPEIVDVLAGSVIQSKLHESIARIRAEQIESEERRKKDDLLNRSETEIDDIFALEAEQGMKEQFKKIDLDGDGYTTIDELTKLLTSLGYALHFAQKEAQFIMNELDLDGDGTIDFNEFAQAWVQRKLSINDKYAHAIFDVFDENGDGFISIQELKHALYPDPDPNDDASDAEQKEEDNNDSDSDSSSEGYLANFFKSIEDERRNEQLEEILNEIDDNRDGKISFEEFHAAMIGNIADKQTDDEQYVPFRYIFNNLSFKEINANGMDPLFESNKDYMQLPPQPMDASDGGDTINEKLTTPSLDT